MSLRILLSCVSLAAITATAGCGAEPGDDAEQYDATAEAALGSCYCAAPYTCGHSRSPSYMFGAALQAVHAAGVSDGELIQTFGDAPASVGTHCPEPGTHESAATDILPSGSPCGRLHRLRMEGFAAWYRTPPSFSRHIHAVWAAAPVLKSSLRNQIASFEQGRNGLVSNAIDTICPITQEEIAAVRNARNGASGGVSTSRHSCFPGGLYCGGDRVSGSSSTLYRCDSDGHSASAVRACSHGCNVSTGSDDSCHCTPGGLYCGGDVVNGNASTLYRCGSDGVSISVHQQCVHGCRVNSGSDDACN